MMVLGIQITKPDGRQWYTAGESVLGAVKLTNKHSTNVSRIVVSLEGILETTIRPISGRESAFGTSRHVLLDRRQTLYSNRNSTSNQRIPLDPGTHSFNFELEFPKESKDDSTCLKCESQLPLSFDFVSGAIKACVCYRIRVIVERHGLLKPNLAKQHTLDYKPLLPFFCCPTQQEWGVTTRSDVLASRLIPRNATEIDEKSVESSRITLEVGLPGPRSLRPGNPVALSISFKVPAALRLAFTPTWIFGLSIRLKARTVASAATIVRAHIGYVDICNIQAILPVEMRPMESLVVLPPALWENCIYPAAIPTFQLCEAERSYQLEVKVDFACSKAERNHTATALIDVKVESGAIDASEPPPEYNWDTT